MIKKISIEIKWALIFVGVSLFWMLIEKWTGLHSTNIDKHSTYTNLMSIPAVLVYVLALLEKKKNFYEGIITYKQSFISGLIITLIVTIISPLTQIITSLVITPEFFPNIIEYSVKTGALTKEAAEQYFSLSNYIIMGLIGAPIMGVLTTAIVSIFVKSSKR